MDYQTDEKLKEITACLLGDSKVQHLFTKYQDETIPLLEHHGLSALIYENQDLNRTVPNINPVALKKAKSHIAMAVANESLKFSECTKIINSLTVEGLEDYVIFKGWALAYSVYTKPWLRPRTDIDILVEQSQVARYHEFLITNGFTREFAIEGDLISYQSGYSKALSRHSVIYIDLHWQVSNRQCIAGVFEVNGIISRAQKIKHSVANFIIPSQVDSMLLACQHRLGHHHSEERLIWLYDIYLLAKSFSEKDWSDFLIKTEELKLANLNYDALTKIQRLFSAQVPEEVTKKLNQLCKQNEPSAIFLNRRLSNWQILRSDISSINGFGNKLRFLRQSAFPSGDYIKQRMATKSVSWGYVKRMYLGLYRLFGN
ncbi:MAG: nucleotidyltransferase family protein [Gammaproteobacteria bacterium]|nr:nucleotidyltransferase family protein [Gammaproteobacteria bacterium]